jgi:hypothetical protein
LLCLLENFEIIFSWEVDDKWVPRWNLGYSSCQQASLARLNLDSTFIALNTVLLKKFLYFIVLGNPAHPCICGSRRKERGGKEVRVALWRDSNLLELTRFL